MQRTKVAVLTRGTLTDPEMLGANPDAVFLMALAELPVPEALQGAGESSVCLSMGLEFIACCPRFLRQLVRPLGLLA